MLDRVGAFEPCFSPGYYEDVDLAFKARAAGWKTIYEPSVTVYHHEYGTAAADAVRLMEAHRPRFVARWRAELSWAEVLREQRRFGEAETTLVAVRAAVAETRGTELPGLRHVDAALVRLYEAWGRPDLAGPYRGTAAPVED